MNSNEDAQKQTTFADAIEAAAIVAGIAGGAFGAYKLGKALPKAGKTVKEGINNIGKKAFDTRYNLDKAMQKEFNKAKKSRVKQFMKSDWIKENPNATLEDLKRANRTIEEFAKDDAYNKILNKNKYKNLRERQKIIKYKDVKNVDPNVKTSKFNPNEKIRNLSNRFTNKIYSIGDSIDKKINPYYNEKSVYQQLKDKIEADKREPSVFEIKNKINEALNTNPEVSFNAVSYNKYKNPKNYNINIKKNPIIFDTKNKIDKALNSKSEVPFNAVSYSQYKNPKNYDIKLPNEMYTNNTDNYFSKSNNDAYSNIDYGTDGNDYFNDYLNY